MTALVFLSFALLEFFASIVGQTAWWGWNLVDLSGATSQYSGCLIWVGRPERFYGWPDMTLLLDKAQEDDQVTSTVSGHLNGWAVDELTQNTRTVVHTRRWFRALERSAMNAGLTLDVERTVRRGRHGDPARKPKRYKRISQLRAELANHDVGLHSHVLAIDDVPRNGLTVGEFLAALQQDRPLPQRGCRADGL